MNREDKDRHLSRSVFFVALSARMAARPSFGSCARRSGWNARLAGVLLASTASLSAAGPANASVAPFSEYISRTKLTGYVFAEHVPTEFENAMHYLQAAARAPRTRATTTRRRCNEHYPSPFPPRTRPQRRVRLHVVVAGRRRKASARTRWPDATATVASAST